MINTDNFDDEEYERILALNHKMAIGMADPGQKVVHRNFIGRQLPFEDVLAEAVRVKNVSTRRHGWSARFLAFGYPENDEFMTRVNDLLSPEAIPTTERDLSCPDLRKAESHRSPA